MRILFSIFLLLPLMTNAADLQQGQVWAYKTRPGESDSTLTVLKVERYNDLGTVVHIRVDGIRMKNPLKGNVITDIPHLPFKESAVRRSVTKLVRTLSSLPEFQDGYDTWKKAYLAGEAGAFDSSVKATLDALLRANWEERK